MLRHRATITRPDEQPDADGVPRPAPRLIGSNVPAAVRPLTITQAAQLRAAGIEAVDGLLYLAPPIELREGDVVVLAPTGGTWTAAGPGATHHGAGGQPGHSATPVVRELTEAAP
jgi:hypothetical protein